MIKAVFFDLDGTLYDRDVLVRDLLDAQHAAFEIQLPCVLRAATRGIYPEFPDEIQLLWYKDLVAERDAHVHGATPDGR